MLFQRASVVFSSVLEKISAETALILRWFFCYENFNFQSGFKENQRWFRSLNLSFSVLFRVESGLFTVFQLMNSAESGLKFIWFRADQRWFALGIQPGQYSILWLCVIFQSVLAIGAIIGTFVGANFSARFSRHTTLVLTAIPAFSGWISLILAKDVVSLMIGRFFVGVSVGFVNTGAPVSEIYFMNFYKNKLTKLAGNFSTLKILKKPGKRVSWQESPYKYAPKFWTTLWLPELWRNMATLPRWYGLPHGLSHGDHGMIMVS